MTTPKQAYTAEFKELAIKRVKEGQRVSMFCRELGLSDQTPRNWIKSAVEGGKRRTEVGEYLQRCGFTPQKPLGDETRIYSDCQHGRSYTSAGKIPVQRMPDSRFATNMISTVTNQGKVRFMLYR